MKPHSDTVKQYPRHTDNTQQIKFDLAKVGFAKVGLKSVWPKSVLAKVGHDLASTAPSHSFHPRPPCQQPERRR